MCFFLGGNSFCSRKFIFLFEKNHFFLGNSDLELAIVFGSEVHRGPEHPGAPAGQEDREEKTTDMKPRDPETCHAHGKWAQSASV